MNKEEFIEYYKKYSKEFFKDIEMDLLPYQKILLQMCIKSKNIKRLMLWN